MTTPLQTQIIFIHHSTGGDLVKHGNVRGLFKQIAPAISFWDYGYDPESIRGRKVFTSRMQPHIYGLRDGSGERLAISFHIPDHNTDPDGLAKLFSQPLTEPPTNALSHILQFDVIAFKSCFPVTAIKTEEQLKDYKTYYLSIRDTIDQYPTKIFVPMTPPPLRANLTRPEQSERARRFANWIISSDFTGERPNIFPYDFFDELATAPTAEVPNVLKPEYCRRIWIDSHPSPLAHRIIAPKWVRFIVQAIQIFSQPSMRDIQLRK